jgi:uncharacterized membrane protein YkvA (DUF1232 family)
LNGADEVGEIMIGPDTAAPAPRLSKREVLRQGLLAGPNLVKLLWRLLRDPRVPSRRKWVVAAAAVYAASPFDLVPEALLPIVGQLDDLLMVAFAVHHLLGGVDEDVRAEYWDGNADSLELVEAVLEWLSGMVPRPIRRLVAR